MPQYMKVIALWLALFALVIIGIVYIRAVSQDNTIPLADTHFSLEWDGSEVTNAHILDLSPDGFMIFIDYKGRLPIIETADGRQIPIANTGDLIINYDH